MIELKVQCDCGQKIKFDVEPVHGLMPFTVTCPVCGKDDTGKANALLQAMAAAAPPAVSVPPSITPLAAPTPGGLRLSGSHAPEPGAALPAADAAEPAQAPPPITTARANNPALQPGTGRKPSFGMGLVGALVGTLAGCLVYYLIFKYPGLRFKLLAVGVGGLAGWLAELIGKGEGSKELGVITAVIVLCGLVGTQYLVTLSWWHEGLAVGRVSASPYAMKVREAKEVVASVPTGSDAEIRSYLTKQMTEAGVENAAGTITTKEIQSFRDDDLPGYQALANGTVTEAQFNAVNGVDPAQESDDSKFKSVFLLLFVSRTNIFALVAAAGLAYKLCANA